MPTLNTPMAVRQISFEYNLFTVKLILKVKLLRNSFENQNNQQLVSITTYLQ